MSKRQPFLYLLDILSAIDRIFEYSQGITYHQFARDQKTIDAIVRNLEIIGEAARHISPTIIIAHHQVPWMRMVSMRNKILHEYFGVDNEILWETIKQDLPDLKIQIQKVLNTIS